MNCRIWDKQESINGVSASDIFKSMPETIDGEVILLENNGIVTNIEIKSFLVNTYNFDNELSALEIGELYVEHLKQEKEKKEEEISTIEDIENDIAYLMLEMAKMNIGGNESELV